MAAYLIPFVLGIIVTKAVEYFVPTGVSHLPRLPYTEEVRQFKKEQLRPAVPAHPAIPAVPTVPTVLAEIKTFDMSKLRRQRMADVRPDTKPIIMGVDLDKILRNGLDAKFHGQNMSDSVCVDE